jgi:peptide/nickel transport system permease protein
VTAITGTTTLRPARWIVNIRRLLAHRTGAAGLLLVTVIVFASLLAPVLAPYAPGALTGEPLAGPSMTHWLGTDGLGRDVLSRIIWGGRISLEAGILATFLAVLVALPIGLMAGYFRGPLDSIVMRATDTVLAFPFIVLAIGVAAILGPSLTNAAIVIGISQLPQQIRIIRGEALSLREQDYVAASVADGAGGLFILRRHLAPNVLNTVIVQASVIMPFAIITESMLSFLGLGVQPPTPSWGVMLTDAQSYAGQDPLLALFPGAAIFIAAIAFNLLGDGLRDALDPKRL